MSRPSVLAVLLNWKRPANILPVLQSLRGQSIPLHIALVECSPDSPHSAPQAALSLCDSVFSISTNIGPCSRFLPPLALPQFRYSFFAVDDHAPGPRHVEYLLACAKKLHPDYATIGMDGRTMRPNSSPNSGDATIVRRKALPYPQAPRPVDFITSSELILTNRVQAALKFRDAMLNEFGDSRNGGDCSIFEDDLILCFGVQLECQAKLRGPVPSFLAPAAPSEMESWRMRRLPANDALSARPDHRERRDKFLRQAIQVGWRSQVGPWEELEAEKAREGGERCGKERMEENISERSAG